MFIPNFAVTNAPDEHHRNERKQRDEAAKERARELALEMTLDDAEGLTVQASNRKKQRDALKNLERERLALEKNPSVRGRDESSRSAFTNRLSKGPELTPPKSFATPTERAPEKSAQKMDVKMQRDRLLFSLGADDKEQIKEKAFVENLSLNGKGLSSKRKADRAQLFTGTAKKEECADRTLLKNEKVFEKADPKAALVESGKNEIETAKVKENVEEPVLFDTAEDEAAPLSMNQTMSGKPEIPGQEEDINALYRNLMEKEGQTEKETLLATAEGNKMNGIVEDPSSEKDLFPMLRQLSNTKLSTGDKTSTEEIDHSENASSLLGEEESPSSLFQGNLATLLANVLSLEMQITSEYWSMMYKEASQSMTNVLKLAPVVASLMRQAYQAQADKLRNTAKEELGSAIGNYIAFAAGVVGATTEMWNEEPGDESMGLKDAAKEERSSPDAIKKAAGGMPNFSNSWMTKIGKWATKTSQITTGMSVFSQGTTSAMKVAYEGDNANLTEQEGRAQAAEKEMDYFVQYHQSAYQRRQDLYQSAQSFFDQLYNLWVQACDSLAQATNQLFRG